MCTNIELNKVTSEVVDAALKVMSKDLYKVILYGSYARGDNTAESDIDIMILLDCSKEKMKEYRDLFLDESSRIGLEYDVLVAVVLREKEDFVDKISYYPFYQNVEREGVELYGRAA
ncbi:MAG: nucleotidyltransferase domain-containing protein [Phascolarctobacterium sp.]|nr:nucleotidyltransferase domain-containing protein [Phascolarctobacterium sp.]